MRNFLTLEKKALQMFKLFVMGKVVLSENYTRELSSLVACSFSDSSQKPSLTPLNNIKNKLN
jgi:hypothetical protein